MNKIEIENAIIEELKNILPIIKSMKSFEQGLPILQEHLWRIADNHGTDGANVFNILMKHFKDITSEDLNA